MSQPIKITSLKIKNISRKYRKKIENSREIFTKILENRESKKVENSRNFSLEKSRERNPTLDLTVVEKERCYSETTDVLYNTHVYVNMLLTSAAVLFCILDLDRLAELLNDLMMF